MVSLPNLLGRTREEQPDFWAHRYANGLTVHTDPFMRSDPGRVLPIGGPRDALLNRLVHHPTTVRGKRVLDVFAGSGVLGLMALKLGAGHVDFVDVNPRASVFTQENCRRNRFADSSWATITASVADFPVAQPYDLALANPPFVVTPPGIEGTLTSRAGPEGSDLVELLLGRIPALLALEGEAYVYLMQPVVDGVPLLARKPHPGLAGRALELTPTQEEPTPFHYYVDAYLERFTAHARAIEEWAADLRRRHGDSLAIQHYVLHIQPGAPGPASWTIVENLASKYGAGFAYPAAGHRDLALGRVMENFVPPER